MKKLMALVLFLSLVISPLAQVKAAGGNAQSTDATNERVIVKMVDSKIINHFLKFGVQYLEKKSNLITLDKPKGKSMQTFLSEIKKNPGVLYVEPDYKVQLFATPNDPDYKNQWHLNKIGAEQAWATAKGSKTVVAVLDDGFDLNHPDLADHFIKPYDVLTGSKKTMPVSDHGTHVSGIIAASADNGIGGAGVAPGTKIIPVNVFFQSMAFTSDIIKGIQYAVDSGADIINMSLGTFEYSKAFDESVQAAYKKGVLIVAASGNESQAMSNYPAGFKNVVSVAATTTSDTKAFYSNYGATIDIAAPGSSIISTMPKGKYGKMSGTSMASPVVAGVAALILDKEPHLTNEQVAYRLKQTAAPIKNAHTGKNYEYKRVNAQNALKYRLLTSPQVSQITDKDTTITLSHKSAFKGKILVSGKALKTVHYTGPFTIKLSIPKQKANSAVSIKLIDEEGNESWPVTRTVKDVTAPNKPTVNMVADNNKNITGKAEAGAAISVKNGKTIVAKSKADSKGAFKVTLKSFLKAGTKLTIHATDSTGNSSIAVATTVKDKTAPKLKQVNKFTIKSTYVKGTTEPYAKVTIKVGDKLIGTGNAVKSGTFSIKVKKQRAGTALKIYLKDGAGNTSSATKLTVKKK